MMVLLSISLMLGFQIFIDFFIIQIWLDSISLKYKTAGLPLPAQTLPRSPPLPADDYRRPLTLLYGTLEIKAYSDMRNVTPFPNFFSKFI